MMMIGPNDGKNLRQV